jgi:hypothetical protein
MNRYTQKGDVKKNKLVVLILLLAVIVMCSAAPARAQGKDNSPSTGTQCFDGSTKLINLGIGFGGGNYYNYGNGYGVTYRRSPAFSFMYEQSLPEKLGPGYLGLGAYLGFQSASYRFDNNYYNNGFKNDDYYYRHSWNYFMIAARGAYHADILNWQKGEIYGGLLLGLRLATYKYEDNDPFNQYSYTGSSLNLAWSLFAGGRYYFTDKVGAFMELGYGISYLTVGVTIKI